MQIQGLRNVSACFTQLTHTPNGSRVLAGRAYPDRNWGAPIPVARDCPVLVFFEPVSKSSLTGFRWVPVDSLVKRDHVVCVVGGADIPGLSRVIQEWGVATPAMGVTM